RRFDHLLDLLTQRSMLEGLSITVSGRTLLVSGQLDPAREARLLAVLSTFNQNDPSRLKARFQNLPAGRPDICMLPAAIVSLGGKADALYVELENGLRLRQGAVLPSGYTVHALTPSAMTLLKDQRLMSLPLGL
ncbi:MAG: type III secretion system inner membrane ring subunit SctD, partial [Microvirgula sp.]